jgi:pyruvate/2-oxoglutarate dehydrogenase complex dihydrolipoamide dehydrogenase (E3) component
MASNHFDYLVIGGGSGGVPLHVVRLATEQEFA